MTRSSNHKHGDTVRARRALTPESFPDPDRAIEEIKSRCKAAGISIAEVQERAGVSRNFVYTPSRDPGLLKMRGLFQALMEMEAERRGRDAERAARAAADIRAVS